MPAPTDVVAAIFARMHDNSAIPRSAMRMSTKSNRFVRGREKIFGARVRERASRSKYSPRHRCRGGVGCDRGYRRSFIGTKPQSPACVVGGGTDDLAVDALLDHPRAPAGGASDDEDRGEHGGRHAQHVVADGDLNQSRLANMPLASAITASIRSAMANILIAPLP